VLDDSFTTFECRTVGVVDVVHFEAGSSEAGSSESATQSGE
jgi:hypothetical protein